jgi:hypothetical protein
MVSLARRNECLTMEQNQVRVLIRYQRQLFTASKELKETFAKFVARTVITRLGSL